MNYLYHARRISVLLCADIKLIKKLNLVIMQMYFIKKFVKKLKGKREIRNELRV